MTILTIRKSLQDYIRFADDKKVKTLFTIVEDEINQKRELWANTAFIDKMQKRSLDLETDELKGTSRENVQKKAKSLLKK